MRLFYRNNNIYIYIIIYILYILFSLYIYYLYYIYNIHIIYILYFEQSLVPCSNQGRGLLSGGANVLAACYACYETPTHRHPKKQALTHKKQTGKQEMILTGRTEGRREGKKQGRQQERNEGLAPECGIEFPSYTCYFQSVASPRKETCN